MCREVFLNIALPLGLAAAGAVYVLITGWLDRRVYRAVQIQATAAVAGRRSFPAKSQIVQALTACQAFAS
jgi:hypothetical protein